METKGFIIKRDYRWVFVGRNQWAPEISQKYIPNVFFDKFEAECVINRMSAECTNARFYIHELNEDESREITFLKLCGG